MRDLVRKIVTRRVHLHAAYVRVFDTPDGKLVLEHIAKEGYVTRPCHVAGDPHTSAMNEGSRRLALSILKFVHRDHQQLVNQITESIDNENPERSSER